MKNTIGVCILILMCLFGCSENSTVAPEYQEVCEDKQLGFDEVQHDPYFDLYYESWLNKACTSKKVGEPCTSYNLAYKITIKECHTEQIN